jgi:hypothetical protein
MKRRWRLWLCLTLLLLVGASLDIHVHYPPDWKLEDKRPAIIFWFGGGFTQGTVMASNYVYG